MKKLMILVELLQNEFCLCPGMCLCGQEGVFSATCIKCGRQNSYEQKRLARRLMDVFSVWMSWCDSNAS